MTLETIIDGLKTYLVANLPGYLEDISTVEIDLGTVVAKQIVLFDMDPDKYKNPLTIYIIPDQETFEATSIDGYSSDSSLSIYVVWRGDTRENLYRKTLRTAAALIEALRADPTLGGYAGDVRLDGMDYYQAVEGNEDLKSAELRFSLLYEL